MRGMGLSALRRPCRGSPCARSLSSGISRFDLESLFPDYGCDISSSITLKRDVKTNLR
jgi:hypothetical protein